VIQQSLGTSRSTIIINLCSLGNNIIGICWGLFVIIWIVTAISTKRSVYRENPGQRLRYMLLLVVSCVLLFDARRLPYPFDLRLIACNDIIAVACMVACIAGLVFCIWARLILGRNWSGAITLKEDHELIERGPYRIVRHPIYTGLLVMFFATAIFSARIGGLLGLPLVFASFWMKLRDEERLMLKQFPDQYAAYERRTKRLIPFVL
jgi:protein-S-isoprenylcysteine O-methyltransferase Ste14